jgi:tetratricopeptide (TPR) repeat protein
MSELRDKTHVWIALGLIVATLAVYWQVAYHDFINFDDPDYVTENPNVQSGLTANSIVWAFTTRHASNWHPLTWISHMIDYQLWGLNAGPHHLTNVLLHTASTLLLFFFLKRITGAAWKSAFVAALFALHPLHVESVAWIAERKDVLSAFFWMLTMWAYVWYLERPGSARYLIVLVSFALGLMAKPMLVTLPFVFFLLDYWPLQRLSASQQARASVPPKKRLANSMSKRSMAYRLLKEKTPFFILVLASSIVTFIVQQKGGAVTQFQALSLGDRIANAFVSYISYLVKTIWPANLAIFYPYSRAIPSWQVAGSALLLIGVFFLVVRAARRYPYVAVGWLWYVGTLVPVIGLVQVGNQSMADRYTYVPLIGVFLIIAWGVPDLTRNWSFRKVSFSVAGTVMLLLFGFMTWVQAKYWQNSFTLYEHALAVTSDNDLAHDNLGAALFNQGRYDEAIPHYIEALRITPLNPDAHNNLGVALAREKKLDEAIAHFTEALRIKPNYAQVHGNMAVALAEQGRFSEAIEHNREASRLNPDYADAFSNMGSVLGKQGKLDEAIAQYSEAIRLKPNNADAHSSIAFLLASQGKFSEAIPYLTETLRIKPDNADAHTNLGNLLNLQGKTEEAIEHFHQALRLKPDLPIAHQSLGSILSKQGKYDEAISHYNEALKLNPNDAQSHYGLGVALSKQGKNQDAITHLTEALRLNPNFADARTELDKLQKRSTSKKS